jgi:hypothetical protein
VTEGSYKRLEIKLFSTTVVEYKLCLTPISDPSAFKDVAAVSNGLHKFMSDDLYVDCRSSVIMILLTTAACRLLDII